MTIVRKALIVVCLLAVAVAAWLWWTRPVRVDMAVYVPADSIVYAEADSIPDIINAITSTGTWRELAQASGVETNAGGGGRLTRLMSFTGLGPSDAVVLARAQVAVTIIGFEAAEESEATLKFTPRAALVAETHTSEWRVKSALEKLVGNFARRSFGAGSVVERKEVDGVEFVTWSAQGERRKVVTAVDGSVAVVGNDEAAVRACLDVRRGARPSLAANEQLKEMRVRLHSEGALAFGFAPQGSAAKAAEVFAPVFVGGVADNAHIQSVLATVLPQLINRTLGSLGWSARAVGGGIEDDYFLSLNGDMPERLRAPLAGVADAPEGAAGFLPQGVYQVSRYNLRDPELAWRSLGAALSSQVDVSSATFITFALEALLKPIGIEHPHKFLLACGPEIVTARLDETSERKVLIVRTLDRDALMREVRGHLGRGARTERIGDVEMLVSADAELGAASFVGDYLLLGSEEDVRACINARAEGRALADDEAFKRSARALFDETAFARTLTDERDSAASVIYAFARRPDSSAARADQSKPEASLVRRAYSVSETRLADAGFEKKTRSSFGLFGEIISRFSSR
jgi:hypothetical protein